jgi:transposase
MSERTRFSQEFKKEAVELLRSSGKTSLEIANDLGINRDNLLRWKREIEAEERNTGTISINPEDSDEIKRLKKEMLILKQERDILKKALGIFSKPEE